MLGHGRIYDGQDYIGVTRSLIPDHYFVIEMVWTLLGSPSSARSISVGYRNETFYLTRATRLDRSPAEAFSGIKVEWAENVLLLGLTMDCKQRALRTATEILL